VICPLFFLISFWSLMHNLTGRTATLGDTKIPPFVPPKTPLYGVNLHSEMPEDKDQAFLL